MAERLRVSSEMGAEWKRPADKFRVEAEDYPIFRMQSQDSMLSGDNTKEQWNIDKTVSTFVTDTADLISVIDGTAEFDSRGQEREGIKADHVIYLDKSARPVCWLVNTFWEDFSEKKRPEHSFLNIDRLEWFKQAGLNVDSGGYLIDPNGATSHRANYEDFEKSAKNVPPEVFARIRALYIPGGVETENLEEIMKMPTKLDGKNLLIVDEVSTTGATLKIAEYLLKRAIPELKSVNSSTFWRSDIKVHGDDLQQRSVPVWYDHRISGGRGIGELNPAYFEQRYEKYPNPRTRAQHLGSVALSEFVDLDKEPGGLSRELMREITQMHKDYQEGKILLRRPEHWDDDRAADAIEAQGLRLAPAGDRGADTFINVIEEIDRRKPM